jgi:hypothetical protein
MISITGLAIPGRTLATIGKIDKRFPVVAELTMTTGGFYIAK